MGIVIKKKSFKSIAKLNFTINVWNRKYKMDKFETINSRVVIILKICIAYTANMRWFYTPPSHDLWEVFYTIMSDLGNLGKFLKQDAALRCSLIWNVHLWVFSCFPLFIHHVTVFMYLYDWLIGQCLRRIGNISAT